MILETALISTVLPAVIDLFKNAFGGISRKWFGLSVDDQLKLEGATVERLKALALLDNPGGTPSQWVVDLRGSFRYIGAIVAILSGVGLMFTDPTLAEMGSQLVTIPFSFIFGERMYLAMKGQPK